MNKYLFLDCDSTLCSIEGIDELAALRGRETEAQVIRLTNDAMNGTVPIQHIFAQRLDLISPTLEMCQSVSENYLKTLLPGVEAALQTLRNYGWKPIIISGGFTQVIAPLAQKLSISDIYAVDLLFHEDGTYRGFNREAPTARNGGKPDIIRQLLADQRVSLSVMVGDGVSDLETKTLVTRFIGFGGIIERSKVKDDAHHYIYSFDELAPLLKDLSAD